MDIRNRSVLNYVVVTFIISVVVLVTGSRAVPTTVGKATMVSAIQGIQQRKDRTNRPPTGPWTRASGSIWTVQEMVVTMVTQI